jgi:hypothetical protein
MYHNRDRAYTHNLTKEQEERFCSLECFDEALFLKHYPDLPDFRKFVLSYYMYMLSSLLSEHKKDGNNNPFKAQANKIMKAKKKLDDAIYSVERLHLYSNGDMVKTLKLQSTSLDEHSTLLKKIGINDGLISGVFQLFYEGSCLPEYKDMLDKNNLMAEVLSSLTGDSIDTSHTNYWRFKESEHYKFITNFN